MVDFIFIDDFLLICVDILVSKPYVSIFAELSHICLNFWIIAFTL